MRRSFASWILCLLGPALLPVQASTPQVTALSTPVISSGSAVYGQTLTFVTTLSPFTTAGDPSQNGTVVFVVDGALTTPYPVDPTGAARISLTLLPGTHSIAAQFSGNASYLPAFSAVLMFPVNTAVSTVAMSATPAQLGQPVTIRAAVTLFGGSSGIPIGRVDFTVSGAAIAACTGVRVQNGAAECITSFPRTGPVTINAAYLGNFYTAPASGSIQITVGKLAPNVYLATTPAAPVFGDTVTVGTLVLGAQGGPTPTGPVTISLSGSNSAVTLDSSGHGSFTLPTIGAGAYAISATYAGDANYQTATATPMTLPVGKVGTLVTLAPVAPQVEQPVTLKATVSLVNWASAAANGTVDFASGGAPLTGCTGLTLQNGAAICSTVFRRTGSVTIAAAYSGDTNTNPSTGSAQVNVGKMSASSYIAASPDNPVYGAPITLDALVLGAQGADGPTGTVTFSEGAVTLGTAPFSSEGRARLTVPSAQLAPFSAGTHTINAVYNGDANYGAGTPVSLTFRVSKASTTISLSANSGGPFTATVTVQAPGTGAPTGLVQFLSGGAAFATAPLTAQGSSFAARVPTGPSYGSITASYLGDANFTESQSAAANIIAPAQVTASSDHNPSSSGESITLTAAVTSATGALAPAGNVQWSVNGVTTAAVMLKGGTAAWTTTLAAGTYTISANYLGDEIHSPGSATFTQTVNRSAVSLALAANSNAAVFGQTVILTAQLTGPSSASPAGGLQFLDGFALLGSAKLSDGAATLAVSNLVVGEHAISASWLGDSALSPAISAGITVTVNKARTATVLTPVGNVLTATVAPVFPGSGSPGGSLSLVDAATNAVIATAGVAAAGATFSRPTSRTVTAVYSGDANFLASTSAAFVPLSAASAASYLSDSFAPDELVTLFGSELAGTQVSALTAPAATLGGTRVTVRDSVGIDHSASLLFVAPTQANILMPSDAASGPATIALTNSEGFKVSAEIVVSPVAPGLFTAGGAGSIPAGQMVRVHADGSSDTPRDLARFDPASQSWVAVPINAPTPGDVIYVILYGTGVRHFASPPTCTVGSQTVPVAYAGPQGGFPGLDQINVPLPTGLTSGPVKLSIAADGVASNAVTIVIQ